jgi:hypothetical protein
MPPFAVIRPKDTRRGLSAGRILVAVAFYARACPPWLRKLCQALFVLAWLNLLELSVRIALDVLRGSEDAPLSFLVRRAFFLSAVPALLAEGLSLACLATVEVTPTALVLVLSGQRLEVPRAIIRGIEALRPPWLRVVLGQGRLPFDLAPRSPAQFAAALGFPFPKPLPRLRPWLYGVLPVVIILVIFNLHQHIAFGGFFGEWRLVSPARWLRTLAGVSLSVYIHVLAWAAVLRVFAEAAALLLPRRAVEVGAAITYVLGIAALLVLRLR